MCTLQLFKVAIEKQMPSVLLESLETDALVAVVEHATVGTKLVAVILIRTYNRYLTWTCGQ